MTAKSKGNGKSNGRTRRKPFKIVGAAIVLAAIGLTVIWFKVVRGGQSPTDQLATFVAKRGPLTISVLESGTIQARERLVISNELEGRTSIIKLVPEGTVVKEGDLLVQLDASTLQDMKIDQEISVEKTEAAYINATETLAVVKNQAQSDIDVAELDLKFAIQDLQHYKEGQYPNEKTAAENDITLRQEELTRADETLEWSQKLYDEKYLSQTQLQADKLAVTRSSNNLQLARNSLKLLEEFTYHRQIDQLESNKKQAEMALIRTQAKARADVVQAEADLKAKKQEFDRQTTKLDKIKDQLSKATIRAPREGMVIYATSSRMGRPWDRREPLDEGVEVHERQELIHFPTAKSMKAEVNIHEASLEKVRIGLPAVITVDALPGKKFLGSMARIAPLPDPQSMWMNPDLKVYNSDVNLEGEDPALRSGMSCKVEIIVEQYEDTVYVPITSVIRVAGQPTVHVLKDGVIEERAVQIGLDNNSMIRIISGLSEGEEVLMAPPLKATSLEPGTQMPGTESSDSLQQQINERLEQANGGQAPGPRVPSSDLVGPPQPGQEESQSGFPGAGQGPEGGSLEQMQRMRERFENMSPEERQQEMERMKQRFENMSPEEREQMRQRFQGSGRRRQGGPGQDGGPGQERDPQQAQGGQRRSEGDQ